MLAMPPSNQVTQTAHLSTLSMLAGHTPRHASDAGMVNYPDASNFKKHKKII